MRYIRNIVAILLSFVVLYLGAGVSLVHVCSHLCGPVHCMDMHSDASECSSSEVFGCCLDIDCETAGCADQGTHFHEGCDCVNYTYQSDYFFDYGQAQAFHVVLYPVLLWNQLLRMQPKALHPAYERMLPTDDPPVTGRSILTLYDTLLI